MSRAYKCDVCGRFFIRGPQDREARPSLYKKFNGDDKLYSITLDNNLDPVNCKKYYDLCSKCATKIMAFIDAKGGRTPMSKIKATIIMDEDVFDELTITYPVNRVEILDVEPEVREEINGDEDSD